MLTSRNHRIIIGVSLLMALQIRTVPLTYSHFWDDAVYWENAKIILNTL